MHLPVWIVRILIVAAVVAVHAWAMRVKARRANADAARRSTVPNAAAGATSAGLASGKPLTPK